MRVSGSDSYAMLFLFKSTVVAVVDNDAGDGEALHLLRGRSALTNTDLEAKSSRRTSRLRPATGRGLEVKVEVKVDGVGQCPGSRSSI